MIMKTHYFLILIYLFFLCICCQQIYAENGTERKLREIKKIITLSEEQTDSIRYLHQIFSQKKDSALYKLSDPVDAAQVVYDASKEWHDGFMRQLSDEQRIRYIHVTSTPEIRAKTQAKVDLLRGLGVYGEEDLSYFYEDIFNYLMKEKVVYVRDKYHISKQKHNISQLKKMRPQALKEANNIEKVKHHGRYNGQYYRW